MLRIAFRTIPTIPSKKLSLKSHKDVRCLLRSYTSKPSICPPPPPKKRQIPKFKIAMGAIAIGCGAVVWYAGQDREFRDELVSWLPFMDGVLKVVYSEEPLKNPFQSIQDKLNKKKKKKIEAGLKQEEADQKKEYTLGDPKPSSEDALDVQALEDLEAEICEAATEAVNAYENAIYLQKSYNDEIEIIVENNIDSIEPTTWESVRQKTKEKNQALKEAEEKAAEANKKVRKLKEEISSEGFEAPESTKILVKNNIQKVQDDIENARRQLEAEKRRGSVAQKYWDKVEKARKQFNDELTALFPDIDINSRHLKISEEDLDLFLLHVYATVLFYQKELAKVETVGREKIKQAYDEAKRGKGTLTPAEFCEMMEQEKRKLTLCFQQQCLKLRKEIEDEMREQMKRQSQAFSDHLEEAVRTREMEIERELSRKFDEQLEEERCKFKMQLAAMVGRLRGLEHAMRARRDADSTAKQAQVLWSACQALTRALRAGCPGIPWKEQIRPLEPELTAVEKAAGIGDELVKAVLSGIPQEAKNRGVFPEDALRERFLKVERVARNVALVPEGGASLPVHFLSYLQGLFLLKAASPIPQAELNDEETDFSKLNTNDILQRARYWLDRGNFEQTLKYMNLLKGAPRCVARQWMNETRILLETQQAANTLMAHAASSGLNYL